MWGSLDAVEGIWYVLCYFEAFARDATATDAVVLDAWRKARDKVHASRGWRDAFPACIHVEAHDDLIQVLIETRNLFLEGLQRS